MKIAGKLRGLDPPQHIRKEDPPPCNSDMVRIE